MKILILTVLMLVPTRMMAAELLAGPMISHTTTSSATIWFETDAPAKVTVDYWTQTGSAMTITRAAVETMTSESYPHTGTVTLNGLVQNTRVHYAISVNGKQVRALVPQVFRTMPAMQPRRSDSTYVAEFSVGFGSCLNPGTQPMQPAFAEALQHRPNAFLFIGDINYMPGRSSHYGEDPESGSLHNGGISSGSTACTGNQSTDGNNAQLWNLGRPRLWPQQLRSHILLSGRDPGNVSTVLAELGRRHFPDKGDLPQVSNRRCRVLHARRPLSPGPERSRRPQDHVRTGPD